MIFGTGALVCCFTSLIATSSLYRTRRPDLQTRLLSKQVTWVPPCRLRIRTPPSLSSPPISRQYVSTEYPNFTRQGAYSNPPSQATQIRYKGMTVARCKAYLFWPSYNSVSFQSLSSANWRDVSSIRCRRRYFQGFYEASSEGIGTQYKVSTWQCHLLLIAC